MGKRRKNSRKSANYFSDNYSSEVAGQPRPGFVKRHRAAFIAFVSLIAVLVVAVAGFAFILNRSLSHVAKIPIAIPEASRPTADSSKALNILMLGADAGVSRNGKGTSIIKDAASNSWPQGKYRSDATMFVHITADRKKAYVISIPRDSFVKVYDSTGTYRDNTKINAALSLYSPAGALSTVEHFTGLRINHLAMVDWDNFKDITDALGGVDISVNGAPAVKMNGTQALAYVRERHHLPHGDFDRVKRQQNFLREVMTKLASKGTLTNPIKLIKTVDAVTRSLAVDDNWSTGGMRSLALAMRNMRPGDITFLTIPTKGTASDPIAGSIVVVDKVKDAELFKAVTGDSLPEFLKANPRWLLGSSSQVS